MQPARKVFQTRPSAHEVVDHSQYAGLVRVSLWGKTIPDSVMHARFASFEAIGTGQASCSSADAHM